MKYQSADVFIISNQVYGSFKQFVGTYEQNGIRITITIQYTWVGRDRERENVDIHKTKYFTVLIFLRFEAKGAIWTGELGYY